MKWTLLLVTLLFASACGRAGDPAVSFHARGQPQKLSEWHVVLADGKRLRLNAGVEPYALNTALFSDYAHKLRTLWLPPGTKAKYSGDAAFEFPVGTIISKTFYYPRAADGAKNVVLRIAEHKDESRDGLDLTRMRMIETRLLVRRKEGWVAFPYVWNEEQTEAVLARGGDIVPLALDEPKVRDGVLQVDYMVPDENQCAGCHATDNTSRAIEPIGPRARHLNRDDPWHPGENQLTRMAATGRLEGLPENGVPRNARFDDANEPLDARARAYLDINCGHCHSAKGPADTSGLWLDAATRDPIRLGECKPPVAAGQGTGDHIFDVVPGRPDESILVYRMSSLDPGAMMPEVGRTTVHAEGVALVRDWIKAWLGDCSSSAVASSTTVSN
jgi:uncharacterized repeat protein (TIGR03806 family)